MPRQDLANLKNNIESIILLLYISNSNENDSQQAGAKLVGFYYGIWAFVVWVDYQF